MAVIENRLFGGIVTAFAEVTMLSHRQEGVGWEIGVCLWSPTETATGQDRYAIMREPVAGDRVFHWVAGVEASKPRRRLFWGSSRVAAAAASTQQEPPNAGKWAGRSSYYRIELEDFRFNSIQPAMDEIERGLSETIFREITNDRPKHYPYVRYQDGFRIAQGIYLTKLSSRLAEVMQELTDEISDYPELATVAGKIAQQFDEGERYRREVTFFRRNPALRKAAIEKYGLICAVCGFDFRATYGLLGEGYIEIHHLRPLAERRDLARKAKWETTVDDVVPLCANCHRMAHRERPALSLDRLKSALSEPT